MSTSDIPQFSRLSVDLPPVDLCLSFAYSFLESLRSRKTVRFWEQIDNIRGQICEISKLNNLSNIFVRVIGLNVSRDWSTSRLKLGAE